MMRNGLLLALLPLMVLVALTTEGAVRATLELAAFVLALGLLLSRPATSAAQQVDE
ncbi:hypothetical protein SAMN04488540_11665 [Ferrimonas sediminum]|uniref:Uncharacterized protein n=1 Tax=Ferrimonas sediminum TaxID=718193 RepID=A0A1G8Y0S8_9GAMM|nr:hypothetical protein [Ferrimonas sediminum]SDJ96449.1 hypothetical protein SAMN04488540_11665 [Ferrimonas sediminum]